MKKNRSDVDVMIEILEDAARRSDQTEPQPRQLSEKRELALIFDLIDAKHIRGEVLSRGGFPRGGDNVRYYIIGTAIPPTINC